MEKAHAGGDRRTQGRDILVIERRAEVPGAPGPTYGGSLSDEVKMKVAKHPAGPFKNAIHLSMDAGDIKNVHLEAKSLSGQNEQADLFISRIPIGVAFKWFTKSGKIITDDVFFAEGFDFTLEADKQKRFRVRLKFPGTASEACYVQPLADDDGQTSEPLVAINVAPAECA